MLTKEDLRAIKKLTDQSVSQAVSRSVSQAINQSVPKMIDSLERRLKKDYRFYFKKEIKKVIDFFDKEHLGLVRRVDRIENHLNLPPLV